MTIQKILEDVRRELTVRNGRLQNAIKSLEDIGYAGWISQLELGLRENQEKMVCINNFLDSNKLETDLVGK